MIVKWQGYWNKKVVDMKVFLLIKLNGEGQINCDYGYQQKVYLR